VEPSHEEADMLGEHYGIPVHRRPLEGFDTSAGTTL
jgi:hypothetical protein